MNTPLFPVAIYPSQLDAFKTKAELLSTSISEALSIKKLSAFKRNDYLAIALGYKGHPDLVESAKFRKNSDTEQQLLIFSNVAIRQSIAKVFCEKLNLTNIKIILECCDNLGYRETIDSISATDISDLKGGSEVEKNTIIGNANNNIFIYLDELGNTPEAITERQGAAKFFTEQEVKNTAKNDLPVLSIDLSEMPTDIYSVFSKHPELKAIDIDANRTDVKYSRIWHKGHVEKGKKGWVIRASFDIWGATEVPMGLIIKWNRFRDWLIQFNPTNRIKLCERIKGHSMFSLHTQVHPDRTINDLIDDLPTNTDQLLFTLFISNKREISTEKDAHPSTFFTPELFEDHVRDMGQSSLKKKS
jgi:hypothetical protein